MNENYAHAGDAGGRARGHPQGHVPLPRRRRRRRRPSCAQLLGSGTILREVIAAQAREGLRRRRRRLERPSFTELRRDGMAPSAGTCCTRREAARKPYVEQCLEGHAGPVVAATDYMRNVRRPDRAWCRGRYTVLGTDGFGRSETR
jgi:pyruvate dehydrogenase E1 component